MAVCACQPSMVVIAAGKTVHEVNIRGILRRYSSVEVQATAVRRTQRSLPSPHVWLLMLASVCWCCAVQVRQMCAESRSQGSQCHLAPAQACLRHRVRVCARVFMCLHLRPCLVSHHCVVSCETDGAPVGSAVGCGRCTMYGCGWR
jgi:hypothetical protein